MTAAGATNTGDKITLALLGQKVDAVIEGQKAILDKMDSYGKEVHRIDTEQCVQAVKLINLESDITDIEKDVDAAKKGIKIDTWLGGIATFLGTIASILGIAK